ncbi:glycosyltransferase family 8 protein [Ewingella americana]
METLHIATGVSRNFYEPLSVMLTSLAETNSNSSIKFNVLHSDFNNDDIKSFKSQFTTYANLEIIFHLLDEESVKDLPLLQHFKISTYFRIIAPNVLNDIDKLLYLDADIIVDGDITPLWGIDLKDYVLAAVREESVVALDKRLKMPDDYKYFNAGVILLNCKKIREEEKFVAVIDYLKENRDEILYLDQDALNAVLYDQWFEVDEKWNYHNTFILKNKGIKENVFLDNPTIIHYTGPLKPWHAESDHILKERYSFYENKLNGTKSAANKGVNYGRVLLRNIAKKFYYFSRKNKYLNKLLDLANDYAKNNRHLSKYYFKAKDRLAPSPQVMSSFQAKEAKIHLPFLESNIDISFYNIREFSSFIQIDGYCFKQNFSTRKTKKYLLFRDVNNTSQVYSFVLNDLDQPWLNDIYHDEFDYSKSGFFNFINKSLMEKGRYEIGCALACVNTVHYKMLGVQVTI